MSRQEQTHTHRFKKTEKGRKCLRNEGNVIYKQIDVKMEAKKNNLTEKYLKILLEIGIGV